jgi:hypothetical protein
MSAAHDAAVQLLNDAKLAGDAGQKLVRARRQRFARRGIKHRAWR